MRSLITKKSSKNKKRPVKNQSISALWGRVFMPSAGGGRPSRRQPEFWRQRLLYGAGIFMVLSLSAAWWFDVPGQIAEKVVENTIGASQKMGFCVRDVMVQGRRFAPTDRILQAVNLKKGDAIFLKSPAAIKEDLEKIPWVKKASVQRRLPHDLFIDLEERQPIALWQHQKIHYLVDASGVVISNEKLMEFSKLPIIVGGDAPLHAPKILALLDKFPDIQKRVTALVRVGGRRWDLQLDHKITVKLPELKSEEAFARLLLVIQQDKLHASDVSVVDLRLPHQMIMRLSPTGAVKITGKGTQL